MNGIDRITERIRSEAKAESDAAIAEARREVAETLKEYEKEAAAHAEEVIRRGEFQAEEHQKRREAVAELEARKKVLEAKQEMLDVAFSRVPEAIVALPDERYIEYLSKLAAMHTRTGREQILLADDDINVYGAAVVSAANALLAAEGKPAELSLLKEDAGIYCGIILRDGNVEVNCSIETILHFVREELSGEVANVLFS